MNFLQLCQKLARDSGTATDGNPSTVVGQTGRMGKIVQWVNDAYRTIQVSYPTWRWLQGTFSGQTIANQRNYDGNDMGVTTRFREFDCTYDENEDRYSIYLTSDGVADEGSLRFLPYRDFFVTKMRGTQTPGKPVYFTIDPAGEMLLAPIPDAAYTIRGPYFKDIQELALSADEPEMPDRHHQVIIDLALMFYLGVADESPQVSGWQLRKITSYNALLREQLPKTSLPSAFA